MTTAQWSPFSALPYLYLNLNLNLNLCPFSPSLYTHQTPTTTVQWMWQPFNAPQHRLRAPSAVPLWLYNRWCPAVANRTKTPGNRASYSKLIVQTVWPIHLNLPRWKSQLLPHPPSPVHRLSSHAFSSSPLSRCQFSRPAFVLLRTCTSHSCSHVHFLFISRSILTLPISSVIIATLFSIDYMILFY